MGARDGPVAARAEVPTARAEFPTARAEFPTSCAESDGFPNLVLSSAAARAATLPPPLPLVLGVGALGVGALVVLKSRRG